MIKSILYGFLFFFCGLSFAQSSLEQEQSLENPIALGHSVYVQNCLKCHDAQMPAVQSLKTQKITSSHLGSAWHEHKGRDLSLLYKQTDFSAEDFEVYLQDFFVQHSYRHFSIELKESDGKYLFAFIDWANSPHKFTASRLGILSLIYLFVLLIFWGLWAIKLQHRVIRRYDRYDMPSFPKNAPENLTKASNDT